MYFISRKLRKKKSIGSKSWLLYEVGLSALDNIVLKLLAFVMPYFSLFDMLILEYHFEYTMPKKIF